MTSMLWNAARQRSRPRPDAASYHPAIATPSAPALNTILAVREHAPAEIAELGREIQALHQRLGAAYSRKRLLEQLLIVIQQTDTEKPAPQTAMSVLR